MVNRNIFIEMSHIKDLTPSERQIITFILNNPQIACQMNIVELGANTYTSASTVSRVIKKLNCDGYAQFKQRVCSDVASYQEFLYLEDNRIPASSGDTLDGMISNVIHNTTKALTDVRTLNSTENFQTAIHWLQTSQKINLYGSGVTNLICQDAAMKGIRMGLDISAQEYYQSMKMQARLSKPNDLGIIVSYTGHTTEMIKIAKILHLNRSKSISITSNASNEIVRNCDLNLYVGNSESFYRIGGVESRMSLQLVLDLIFTGYYNQTPKAKDASSKTFVEDTFGVDWKENKQ